MPPSVPVRQNQGERSGPKPRQHRPAERAPVKRASTRQTSSRPRSPGAQERPPTRSGPGRPPTRRRRRRWRSVLVVALLVLVLLVAGLWFWAESRLTHVDALSGAADTPGQTYLIVGSDVREGPVKEDGTEGERSDTIIVLHQPVEGPTALISIPRDSYVEIPGHDKNKINASYAFGGAPLLVETVELLTGMTIDHYLEVGFSGVSGVVDALGGVELCLDRDVDDRRSKLEWEAGCHLSDGDTAVAFARMRYSDPIGDIGRTERQQQLVAAVADGALSTDTLLNPRQALSVADAGLGSLRVSDGTGAIDLARAALVFNGTRDGQAVTGTPPLVSIGHDVPGVGSTVLLDEPALGEFWRAIAGGEFEPGTEVGGVD